MVLTGLEDEALASESLAQGVQDYVVKGVMSPPAFALVLRYAHERARAADALNRAQRVETVAQMAGGVAHDFNNMLQVIRGHASLLSDDIGTGEARESLDAIDESAPGAMDLTRQLLSFGARSTGPAQQVAIDQTIERMRPILTGLMGSALSTEFDLGAPGLRVLMEKSMLEQSVLNLALNSRYAMRPGGTLSIRTRPHSELDVPQGSTVPWVSIEVSDDGTGMAPETVERASSRSSPRSLRVRAAVSGSAPSSVSHANPAERSRSIRRRASEPPCGCCSPSTVPRRLCLRARPGGGWRAPADRQRHTLRALRRRRAAHRGRGVEHPETRWHDVLHGG